MFETFHSKALHEGILGSLENLWIVYEIWLGGKAAKRSKAHHKTEVLITTQSL